jgi:hypothetical protein
MPNSEESPLRGLLTSWPALVALLFAVGGLLVAWPRLESPRPTFVPPAPTPPAADGSVPSRLWQDPVSTALAMSQLRTGFGPAWEQIRDRIKVLEGADGPDVLFLLAVVRADMTPEVVEGRRRERYATLSALSTAGYVPAHPGRLACLSVPLEQEEEYAPGRKDWQVAARLRLNATGLSVRFSPDETVDCPDCRKVPYEWVLAEGPCGQRCDAVCVLWVPQYVALSKLFDSLYRVKTAIDCAPYPWCDKKPHNQFAITGRIDSAMLSAIVKRNYDLKSRCRDNPFGDVSLYVTNATAPYVREQVARAQREQAVRDQSWLAAQAVTSPGAPDPRSGMASLFGVRRLQEGLTGGLRLEYVIGTDQELADKLVDELREHGIRLDSDPIALIAERDTHYGRGMFTAFENAGLNAFCPPGHVHRYSYLRGLDGKVPGDKKGPQPEDGGQGNAAAPGRDAPKQPTSKDGEGDPQVDYLRRLADQMKADHQQFRAIGIVGSDVYDKHLLLKALRPCFPQALFFTTDLDARLLQPGDYSFTRNLLIASHYGLFLRDDLQDEIPPFRSGYDTASYLGVLRAVQFPALCEMTTNNSNRPVHLYEVGRSGPYELTVMTAEEDPLGPPNPRARFWRTWRFWYRLVLSVLIALVVGSLLYPISRPWRGFLRSWGPWQGLALVSVALGLLLAVLIGISHGTSGEPFELFEGLSVWPTVVLRFLASVFCVYAVLKGLEKVRKGPADIREHFCFAVPAAAAGAAPSWSQRCRQWLGNIWAILEVDPKSVNVREVWEKFEEQGTVGRRLWRCLFLSLLYLALFGLLWLYFDHTQLQASGPVARWTDFVVLLLAGATLVGLLMFVVDCTLLSYRLVTHLARRARDLGWEPNSLQKALTERGLDGNDPLAREAASQWFLLRLMNESTHDVAHLIYYPFVALLILIVAQNGLFDNWHLNLPLLLVGLLSAGTALGCALLLQGAAWNARKTALETLRGMVLQRGNRQHDELREGVERIRQDVEGMRSGAFAGFFQNPVVGALLLPLGGGGGLAAMEAVLPYL